MLSSFWKKWRNLREADYLNVFIPRICFFVEPRNDFELDFRVREDLSSR